MTRPRLLLLLLALFMVTSVLALDPQISFVLGQEDGITVFDPKAPSSSRSFIKHSVPVLSLDVDVNSSKVYWAAADGKIFRANLDGTAIEKIKTPESVRADFISVDWISGNIFYADRISNTIGVCCNDGGSCAHLGDAFGEQGIKFAVSPIRGELYVLNEPLEGYINKINLETSEATQIDQKDDWFSCVAVDYDKSGIVFNGKYKKTMYETNVNEVRQSRVEFIDDEKRTDISAVDVAADNICWARSDGVQIECMRRGTRDHSSVYNHTARVTDMKILHPSRQPRYRRNNDCQGKPCSHVCVLTRKNIYQDSYRCLCPPGLSIQADKRTCL